MRVFSNAWSLPAARQRWRSHRSIRYIRKLHTARKLHGSLCYKRVIFDRSFTLRERGFWTYFSLWRGPWLDNLYLRTWPVFPVNVPDVRKWTSYVKAFGKLSSDRQTDRQTDTVEITHNDALWVVSNVVLFMNVVLVCLGLRWEISL